MKRTCTLMAALLALTWTSAAQNGTQAQSQTGAGASTSANANADKGGVNAQSSTSTNTSQDTSMASGTTLNAVLTKSVDSRKAKEGDEITAKTTGATQAAGERPIPKGTKLIGHVTKATAKGKGDADSSLGILFDRAEVGKGREIPIHAVVQALAATTTNSAMAMNDEPAQNSPAARPANNDGGGGLVGGTVAGVGKTVDNTTNGAGNVTRGAVGSASGTVRDTTGGLGATTSSTLNATSQGVVGLPGYTLDAAAANATQGSLITSTGKNVKLESGTQMLLRVVSH